MTPLITIKCVRDADEPLDLFNARYAEYRQRIDAWNATNTEPWKIRWLIQSTPLAPAEVK